MAHSCLTTVMVGENGTVKEGDKLPRGASAAAWDWLPSGAINSDSTWSRKQEVVPPNRKEGPRLDPLVE